MKKSTAAQQNNEAIMELYLVENDKTGERDIIQVFSINEISLLKWTKIKFLRKVA